MQAKPLTKTVSARQNLEVLDALPKKPENHLQVMKEARKKRKAKKRDLSDAIIVKSAVVIPPYRTEHIIPDPACI